MSKTPGEIHYGQTTGTESGIFYQPQYQPPGPPPYSHSPMDPPQPPYPTSPPAMQAAIVMPTVVGPQPSHVTCPSCRAQIVTRVDTVASTKTHLMAGILFLIGCWPCCCIPYCVESCQSKTHYCPNCNAYIGTYSN